MPPRSKTPGDESSRVPAIQRREWLIVGMVLTIGVVLRMAPLRDAVIEHFDEGVYASNIWFDGADGYRYPMQHFYAPPFLPWLIEWSMILSGSSSAQAAVFPSCAAGVATMLVAWWLARCWFGPTCAIATLSLITFNDVHRLFSMAALTDALLLFWLVAGLGLLVRAHRTGRLIDFALAGAVTGLAWWTKYNGWLPLAIAIPAWAGWWVVQWRTKSNNTTTENTAATVGPARLLVGWLVAAITAFLMWSPYLYELQQYGGYVAIATNHRQYVVGPSGWFSSLNRQLASFRYVDTLWGSLGWGIAVLLAGVGTRWRHGPSTQASVKLAAREWCWFAAAASLAFAIAQWIGASALCLLFAAVVPIVEILWPMRATKAASNSAAKFMLVSWFLVMLILTPLYTPYLRLTLPLLGAAWLASGLVIDATYTWMQIRWSSRERDSSQPARFTWAASGVVVIASLFVAALAPRSGLAMHPQHQGATWKDITSSIQRTLLSVPATQPALRGVTRIFYVYGEPGMLFHLRAAGESIVIPVGNLDLQPGYAQREPLPTYLIAGLHAQRDPRFREEIQKYAARFELLQTFEYQPGTLVLLDQFDPRQADLAALTAEVRLYRITSQENATHDHR